MEVIFTLKVLLLTCYLQAMGGTLKNERGMKYGVKDKSITTD